MNAKQWIKDYVDFAVALVAVIILPLWIIYIVFILPLFSLPNTVNIYGNIVTIAGANLIGTFYGIFFQFIVLSLIMRVFTKNFWFAIPMTIYLVYVLIAITPGGGNFFAGGWTWTMTFQLLGAGLYFSFIVSAIFFVRTLFANIDIFKKFSYILVIVMLLGMVVYKITINTKYYIANDITNITNLFIYFIIFISFLLFILTAINYIYLAIKKKDNLIIPQDFGNYFMEIVVMRNLFEKKKK